MPALHPRPAAEPPPRPAPRLEAPVGVTLRTLASVLGAGALVTAVDIAMPFSLLKGWVAIGLQTAGLGLWGRLALTLLREDEAAPVAHGRADADDQRRARAIVLAIAALILLCLVGKLGVMVQAQRGADAATLLGSYRTFTVFGFLGVVLGLVGRPRRLAAIATRVAEHPARLMASSFGLLCLLGALLLSLPFAVRDPARAGLVDALFMATSAVCVTGLAVQDVAQSYTPLGQAVLLALVQVGGLGIMVLYSFFALAAGQRLRVSNARVMSEMLDIGSLAALRRTLLGIVGLTLAIEAVGAALLYLAFLRHPEVGLPHDADSPLAGAGSRWWAAVFHAVSAFCNAGFSLFRGNLTGLVGSWPVNLVVMMLITLGGIGFPVMLELIDHARQRRAGRRPPRLSLHARVVLVASAALVLVGALALLILEWGHSLAGLPFGDKVLASLFQSVTLRTAGFNSVDFGAMTPATLLLCCVLMFIGGSPGSTAGGVKTTTAAVLFAVLRAELRQAPQPHLLDRSLGEGTVRRALGLALVGVLLLTSLLTLLMVVERAPPIALFFESVSAMGTVGVSTGITPALGVGGKLVITLTMFIGRIGPLTLALALANTNRAARLTRPEERIAIG